MIISNDAIVRVSNFHISDIEKLIQELDNYFVKEDYIHLVNQVLVNKELKKAIYIASPVFISNLKNIRKFSIKKQRKICLSLYKYILRAAYRATPFGSFAKIGKAVLNKKLGEDCLKILGNSRSHIYLAPEILDYFYNEILDILDFKKSYLKCYFNAATQNRRHFFDFYLPSINEDASEGNRLYFYKNDVLNLLIDCLTKNSYTLSDLIFLLTSEFPQYSESLVIDFLKELLKQKLIILNIYPLDMNIDTVLQLIESSCKHLKCIEYLGSLLELMDSYSKSKSLDILEKIDYLLHEIDTSEKYIINEELSTESSISLSNDKIRNITKFADFVMSDLNKSYSRDRVQLEQYKNIFSERYGYYKSVNLVELFDDIKGLGSPFSKDIVIDQNLIEEKLWEDELKTLYEFDEEKVFNLAKLKNANRNENIRGFDLNFNIYGSDKNFILSLGRSAYSRTPRGYHGRFEFLELNEIHSFTHGIIYYPKDKKIKNVVTANKNRYKNNIIINTYKNNDMDLSLSDVYVGISSNNEFYLHDNSGNRIIVDMRGMMNLDLSNDYIKFLGLLNSQTDQIGGFLSKLESLSPLHQKRIVFNNIIIIPEKWTLYQKLYKESSYESLLEFLNRNGVPSQFALAINDQILTLDITRRLDLELLEEIFRKEEMIEIYEDLGFIYGRCPEGRFASELTVTLFDNNIKSSDYRINPVIDNKDRFQKLLDGEGWFYVKLYCSKNLQNYLLEYIADYISTNCISNWFYIRYQDDRPHIRLRIYLHGNGTNSLQEVFSFISIALTLEYIDDYSICPYEREYERYGAGNYNLIEKFFMVDSKLCLDILKLRRNLSNTEFKSLNVYVALGLLQPFLEKIENQEFIFRQKSNKLDKSEANLIKSELRNNNYFSRCQELKSYKECKDLLKSIINQRTVSYEQLADSLLHMHFNRLFGDLDLEFRYRNYILEVLNAAKNGIRIDIN